MLKTAIILNGPPGSGKDTLADLLVPFGFHKHQFKEALYRETAAHYRVPYDRFVQRATNRHFKEQPWEPLQEKDTRGHFQPLTPRDALIHVSENLIKPHFGKDFFGQAAVMRCRQLKSAYAVFSDGGFMEEVAPLQEAYDNVVIFRLRRNGFDFEGDSRNYLVGLENTFDLPLLAGRQHLAVADILQAVDPYIDLNLPLTTQQAA